jgi:hypothetical protein
VIITTTLVIVFSITIALAARAVTAEWRAGRKQRKNLENKCKEMGIPFELYLEYEKMSSIALGGYIELIGESSKNPQKIEHLKLLQQMKLVEEEVVRKIAEEKARVREQAIADSQANKDTLYSVAGSAFIFLLMFGVIAAGLYAFTLVNSAIVFSWLFVLIMTTICFVLVWAWHSFRS